MTSKFLQAWALSMLVAVNLGVIACSGGTDLSSRNELVVGKKVESKGSDQVGRATPTPAATLLPEPNPFQSGELVAETLLALSNLPPQSLANVVAGDISTSSATSKCGFVAVDADITNRLTGKVESSGWALPAQGNMLSRSSPTDLRSFNDCRCLVGQVANQNAVFLVPISSQ